MPRQARKRAESGIYHIMLRGINQQQIFEAEEDNQKFLQILKECREVSGFRLLAYCLMGNHIHLLLRSQSGDGSLIDYLTNARRVSHRHPVSYGGGGVGKGVQHRTEV